MITNKIADSLKPKDRPYKVSDLFGLYLYVSNAGTKSWRYNYAQDGKQKTLTLGKYPNLGIADAREKLRLFKLELENDVLIQQKTFDELKREWYIKFLPTLINLKHKQQVQMRIDRYASPFIGNLQLDAIKRVNLVAVVQRIDQDGKHETAHRVAIHLRQIFDYAVDLGYIESHACTALSRVLTATTTTNMACVPISEAGDLLRKINGLGSPLARIGLLLAAATFVRPNELRGFRRSEIRDKRFWVIPAERMKGRKNKRKPHVVPLSDFALQMLKEIEIHTGGYDYVFQSDYKNNAAVSSNLWLNALYTLGYKGRQTVHGFRSLASTVLNEQPMFRKDVIERQLAHKESEEVRAAYNRAEYLDERIAMMQWWGEWLSSQINKALL